MESVKATAYAVYCPERETFLGKLGQWFTDVRLAAVYSEPNKAKMALNRADTLSPCVVVPVTLTVDAKHVDTAVQVAANAAKREQEEASKPTPKTETKNPLRTPAKTG